MEFSHYGIFTHSSITLGLPSKASATEKEEIDSRNEEGFGSADVLSAGHHNHSAPYMLVKTPAECNFFVGHVDNHCMPFFFLVPVFLIFSEDIKYSQAI